MGHFHWVLHESRKDATVWTEVEASVESFPRWIDAFAAVNLALLKLVHDERIGPRALGEDEDAEPVG